MMPESGYRQFCPVAKGAEIVATRWTPLVLRELMCGEMRFNDIHRGVPRMSRSLLSARLQQLEADGIVRRVQRSRGNELGSVWTLTPAGDALREVVEAIGKWGLIHGRQNVTGEDFDSTVLMWALRRRINRTLLPPHRVVIRFDLSGVARCRTGLRLHWLVLEPDGVDVCLKDPGHPVDAIVAGPISILIDVYLGYRPWREAVRGSLTLDGSRTITGQLEKWLRLDHVVGRDLPIVPPRPA
ncbi:winged helix-turn-helix transcriptional regulator [Ciceribacter azotifigens]|uniref:winged helix-turn-helix transcriptional regulator n=1 Tax=Ciceribacter azotifigens TaxID=2069303 RepID=UPI003A894943